MRWIKERHPWVNYLAEQTHLLPRFCLYWGSAHLRSVQRRCLLRASISSLLVIPRLVIPQVSVLGLFVLLLGVLLNSDKLAAQGKPLFPKTPADFCSSVSEIPTAECEALEAFYSATQGGQWSYNHGWLKNSRPCTWVGIECTNGRVAKLSLSFNLISGPVPKEIGNLTELRSLNLIRNKITSIPSELGRLTELRELYLTGNRLRHIPPEIGNLQNLTILHLSDNGITSLPREMGQLEKLDILHLQNASLFEIPNDIQNLTNLRELYFTTGSVSAISSALAQMTQLEVLSLPRNQLTLFPPAISTLTSLRQLNLSDNNLVDIPPAISGLTQLEKLDLSTNQIAHIPDEIAMLKKLTFLDLSNNQLAAVPKGIGLLHGLERLDITANQLAELPTEVGYLTNLYQGLHLAYNRLDDLPDAVESSSYLRNDWLNTQTVAPKGLAVTMLDEKRARLTWAIIPYADSPGYYEVSMAKIVGGPYNVLGRTRSKAEISYDINMDEPGIYYFIIRTYTSAHEQQDSYLWSEYSDEAILYFPKLAVEPSESTVGSTVGVHLQGFPPLQAVKFYINNMDLQELSTDRAGNLIFSLDTASADSGRYMLHLTATVGLQTIEANAVLLLTKQSDERDHNDEYSSSDKGEWIVQIPSDLALSLSTSGPSTLVFMPFTP